MVESWLKLSENCGSFREILFAFFHVVDGHHYVRITLRVKKL